MNSTNTYKLKYLKYKAKYNKLIGQIQYGGDINNNKQNPNPNPNLNPNPNPNIKTNQQDLDESTIRPEDLIDSSDDNTQKDIFGENKKEVFDDKNKKQIFGNDEKTQTF